MTVEIERAAALIADSSIIVVTSHDMNADDN